MADSNNNLPVGLILAGGQSRRMGKDKRTIKIGNRTLFDHVRTRIEPQAESVIVSQHNNTLETDLTSVEDGEWPGLGPLAGILAGLEWCQAHHKQWLLVVPSDAPRLPLDLASRLTRDIGDKERVAIAVRHGRRQPLFSLWHTSLINAITNALKQGDYSVNGLLKSLNVTESDFSEDSPDPFINLNTPADLAQYQSETPPVKTEKLD